ncbi:MAG TPA: ferritin family protein [Thermodesulfovibrionales bacterium]|nr:ferritin family protein [Thermodesulfovibrionales bacterium]
MTQVAGTSGRERKRHISAKSVRKISGGDAVGGLVATRARFFEHAAEKTRNPIGKKMFLSMMEDEKEYGESFQRVAKGLGIRLSDIAVIVKKMKSFLERNGKALLEKIKASTDEVEAVRIAMEMEKKNIELCEKLSRKVRNPKVKAFFEGLVNEERQLYTVFANTSLFLSSPGIWFMSDEHSMMDGGTPWA